MDLTHGNIYKDKITGWTGKCLLPSEFRNSGEQPDFETRVDLIGVGPKGVAESRAISDRNELELVALAEEIAEDFIPDNREAA